MIKDYNKFLKVSQILNNSFGTDGPGGQIVNGINVSFKPINENSIRAMAIMNVSFTSDQMMRELLRKYRDEALAMIKASLERVKEEYKIQFDEDIKISFDDKTFSESTEFYQVNSYNHVSRAFYRVFVIAQIEH